MITPTSTSLSSAATHPEHHAETQHHRFVRLGEVLQRTGMSRSWIYREVAEGCFPKPVKLNLTSVWLESEINAWIAAKIAQRDRV